MIRPVAALLTGLLPGLALAACAGSGGSSTAAPFDLPVGPTEWDLGERAWVQNGVLHVGDRRVTIGDDVSYVLSPTGAFWVDAQVLMFTDAEDETSEVWDLQSSSELAVSDDHSTLALLDGSHGPTDEHGTHALQVVVFDTRTGEQLYRSPGEEPGDADLADLYEEGLPDLHGVTDEQVFFDGTTIDIATGEVTDGVPDGAAAGVVPSAGSASRRAR